MRARDVSTLKILRKNGKLCRTCCEEIPPGGYGYNCVLCPTPAKTPKYITVTFYGVNACTRCGDGAMFCNHININDHPFLLEQTVANHCKYHGEFAFGADYVQYTNVDCTGGTYSYCHWVNWFPTSALCIDVEILETGFISVKASIYCGPSWSFSGSKMRQGGCLNVTDIPNDVTYARGCYNYGGKPLEPYYGGYADVVEGNG